MDIMSRLNEVMGGVNNAVLFEQIDGLDVQSKLNMCIKVYKECANKEKILKDLKEGCKGILANRIKETGETSLFTNSGKASFFVKYNVKVNEKDLSPEDRDLYEKVKNWEDRLKTITEDMKNGKKIKGFDLNEVESLRIS